MKKSTPVQFVLRILIYCVALFLIALGVVLAAVVLSLVFLGTLDGIREGTVLMAMFVGRMISVLRKPISPVVKKICFGE